MLLKTLAINDTYGDYVIGGGHGGWQGGRHDGGNGGWQDGRHNCEDNEVAGKMADMVVDMNIDKVADEVADMVMDMEDRTGQTMGDASWSSGLPTIDNNYYRFL